MFYRNYMELTWEEIKAVDKENCYLIFPVSSIEQHGRHLPVGTDDFILKMCMEELRKKKNNTGMEFLCLPDLKVGTSCEHMNFPGTVTFSVTTYFSVIHDIVASVAKHSFNKMIIVNGHGGNTALLSGFSQELNLKYDLEIYNLELPALYASCNEAPELSDIDTACEIHAGDIEASLLLYKYPQVVHMEKAENMPLYIESFYNSWVVDRLSLGGTMGKPLNASADRGRLILDYMMEKMMEVINKIIELRSMVND